MPTPNDRDARSGDASAATTPDSILVITEEGRRELAQPAHGLSLRQRRLLSLVDGSATLAEVARQHDSQAGPELTRNATRLVVLSLARLVRRDVPADGTRPENLMPGPDTQSSPVGDADSGDTADFWASDEIDSLSPSIEAIEAPAPVVPATPAAEAELIERSPLPAQATYKSRSKGLPVVIGVVLLGVAAAVGYSLIGTGSDPQNAVERTPKPLDGSNVAAVAPASQPVATRAPQAADAGSVRAAAGPSAPTAPAGKATATSEKLPVIPPVPVQPLPKAAPVVPGRSANPPTDTATAAQRPVTRVGDPAAPERAGAAGRDASGTRTQDATIPAQGALVERQPAPPSPAAVPEAAVAAKSAVTAVRPLVRVEPEMPTGVSLEVGSTVVVRARLIIAVDGAVERVDIVNPKPATRAFEQSVRRAGQRWRFSEGPAGRGFDVEFEFRMQ